jgi:hypothetical protein
MKKTGRFGFKISLLTLAMQTVCALCSGQQVPAEDKALLAKFEAVCKKMTATKGDYTLAGVMNIVDKADPVTAMRNVDFLFCKKGDEFYYKLGTTATINEQDAYLYIDYQTKTVLLSQKKELNYDEGMKQLGDLGAKLEGEHYKVFDKIEGNNETISLINEQHISCKLYAVTFDKRTLKISRLRMRLSNANEPLRTDNEKTVDVSVSTWDSSADLSKYLTKNKVIKNRGNRWETVNEFKNYRLVKM